MGQPKLLVTGGNGFVGRALVARLMQDQQAVRATGRRAFCTPAGVESVAVSDLSAGTDWTMALQGVGCVVHLAARVHVMAEAISDHEADYRRINTDGTLQLARQAADAGVRRFVYISSIKVNGESTASGRPFFPDTAASPRDAYGRSKHAAEIGLREIARRTGLEVVVVRPTLVYGPGVRANFLAMMRWLHRGWPIPLGLVRNQRSLVGIDNLVDLLTACSRHPRAAGQTFLAADGEDLSTPQLLVRLGRALGRPARLLPVPIPVLKFGAALVGKGESVRRVCDSLQVSIDHASTLLDWTPPVSVDESLRKTAEAYLLSAKGA